MEHKVKQHKKPPKPQFVRGEAFDKTVPVDAVKFFVSELLMMVAFLMLGVIADFNWAFLRYLCNGLFIGAALLIFFEMGCSSGTNAVSAGEMAYDRLASNRTVQEWERKLCYHPLKGLIAGLLGSIPLLICSVLLMCLAQRQMTSLGALPTWLTTIERRVEVGNALAYYHEMDGMTLESLMRLVVRIAVMPYVCIIGPENKDAMLLLERLSPLVNLLPALAYGLGYTNGVNVRAQVHANIALGKKRARKKQQKELKQRQQNRQKGPEQLN